MKILGVDIFEKLFAAKVEINLIDVPVFQFLIVTRSIIANYP